MWEKQRDCIFCDSNKTLKIIAQNRLAYARWDGFPVSKGHAEIIPRRHVVSYFDLSQSELAQMFVLAQWVKELIDKKHQPDGYTIGFNEGEAAGRTIHHVHMHIIPRYWNDVENPRGGIRNIIPGKGDY